MKLLVLATWLSGFGPLRAPATLHSHLLVAAGKQFLLGAASAAASPSAATRARGSAGTTSVLPGGLLVPGRTVRLRFAAGSQARLFNRGAQPAVLELAVTGDTKQLSMTYEPVGR